MPELVTAWRGPGPGRPRLPLPPDRMPAWRGGRPLKRWTWVGAFGPELMLCAAVARIGPATAAWWAVWDREAQRLQERSLHRAGGLVVTPERVHVPGVMELEVGTGTPVEVVSPHGAQHIWTRKRGGVAVRGRVGGREVDLRGLVDESAGYHARRTAWLWSAGVGVLATGEPVAWNLVHGLHDAPSASERTVWTAGEPREVPPVAFDGLAGVGDMRFGAEATRARRERLVVMASDYEQPFGTFTGALPGGAELREGWGVMERHAVRW
jgi:Protein of unknown function (DUF2804)